MKAAVSGGAGLGRVQVLAWVTALWLSWGWVVCLARVTPLLCPDEGPGGGGVPLGGVTPDKVLTVSLERKADNLNIPHKGEIGFRENYGNKIVATPKVRGWIAAFGSNIWTNIKKLQYLKGIPSIQRFHICYCCASGQFSQHW